MSMILFIFNVIFTINVLIQGSIENLKSKVDLMIYLKEDADILLVNQLVDDLESLPEIKEVKQISKEEALASLLEKYSTSMDYFQANELENPLPSSIQILTETPQDHEAILEWLEKSSYQPLLLNIESNQENEEIGKRLITITDFTQKLLLGILLTFLLGSTLIMANTIHMNILQKKHEIEVMRLVGAPLGFIRAPFMMEGGMYGICAVIASMILLVIFKTTFELDQAGFVELDIRYGRLFVLELLTTAVIGIMSSFIALHPLMQKQK